MMGGDMWVESTEGLGSTFYFSIVAEVVNSNPSQISAQETLQSHRAIVFEHNPTTCALITSMLCKWGVQNDAYTSLQELEAANQMRTGALTYDHALVGITVSSDSNQGCSILNNLHELFGPNLRIITMSSIGDRHVIEEFRETYKVDSCLVKPIKQKMLYNALMGNKAIRVIVPQPILQKKRMNVHMRILLAEDNIVNQKVAVKTLAHLGYPNIDVVGNGLEVLSALECKKYDLLLLDVKMPTMDGIQAAREICKRYLKQDRPYIIAMTAGAMEGDRAKCLQAGMDDYVPKPIQRSKLSAALDNVISYLHLQS